MLRLLFWLKQARFQLSFDSRVATDRAGGAIPMTSNSELDRLAEITDDSSGWRRWGPYVSDRSWGTVREDYSADGNAWAFLTHDEARSKAYRWGEDGIAAISDRYQLLVFGPAFWNGHDPILKERLFGLDPREGNHGEDVKEYYFHLDNTPTHSYMSYLFKYPHAEFPYDQLVEENQRRRGQGPEFELLDTGVFEDKRYFDILIEYAKTTTEDICIRIEATNRGPEPADLHLLPHLWFRNTWSWQAESKGQPLIRPGKSGNEFVSIITDDSAYPLPASMPTNYQLGPRTLYAPAGGQLLFTDNETNSQRLYRQPNLHSKHTKDAFHRQLIQGEAAANVAELGTKACIHYTFKQIGPGASAVLRCRLSDQNSLGQPLSQVDETICRRKAEADKFYESICNKRATLEERKIQRSAFAGLFWNKQSYIFDVHQWLIGDNPANPPPASHANIRNQHWKHLNSMRILTIPDKWEYPWFAAWDLAFHCVSFALVDPKYAKEQLWLMLFEQFQHPNGQIPAYEWEFSDMNPPVHAWAVWRVYNMDRIRSGVADYEFLERCFQKLLINFTWWVNKVDHLGNNVFEGGFLGLDNITVVDRSVPLGDGIILEQADATGWMGMFCQQMMRIALELAKRNPVYEGLATKFFQHYIYIAAAMNNMGNQDCQLWDEEDGFFYDVLRYPDAGYQKFRVRSMVGLIPLFAVERLERKWIESFKEFTANLDWFLSNRRDLCESVVHTVNTGQDTTHVLTIVNRNQLTRILDRVWDTNEFLSPYGIRSLSKAHQDRPFRFQGAEVGYEPAEAVSKLKGGNSNWRGPIWFPTSFLLIESLRKLGTAFGPDFTVSPPAMDGRPVTMMELGEDLANRLTKIFLRDEEGRRPAFGETRQFQDDPFWNELILFFEYFHGDHGAGLGASHQTGWTALVANLIDEWRK